MYLFHSVFVFLYFRPDQVFAKAETKGLYEVGDICFLCQNVRFLLNNNVLNIVSPSGGLQEVSPPVTPAIAVNQSGSPAVVASPVVTTRSPVTLTHRSPATIHNQSPLQQNTQRLLPIPQRTSTNTPPPPPPPIYPQVSPAHTAAQVRHTEASPKNSIRSHPESLSKQQENTTFNGLHNFSQSQLHPLQQATFLLQQVLCYYLVPMLAVFSNFVTLCSIHCYVMNHFYFRHSSMVMLSDQQHLRQVTQSKLQCVASR